jgi:hypothetical protein
VKKLLPWLAVAFVIWWIASDPHGAAAFARSIGSGIHHAAVALSTFASSI